MSIGSRLFRARGDSSANLTPSSTVRATLDPGTANDLSKEGLRLLQGAKFGEAADHYCRAYIANMNDISNLTNCGAAIWIGVKKCFELLARVTIAQCKCSSSEALFIYIIYDWFCGMQLENAVLPEQVRSAVGYENACMAEHCVATAEKCFRKATEAGDGIALVWLIDVLRSTGEFDASRAVLSRAQRANAMPQDNLASAASFANAIPKIESDITWLANAKGGWVIPTADRFQGDKLQEVATAAGKVNERLAAVLSS